MRLLYEKIQGECFEDVWKYLFNITIKIVRSFIKMHKYTLEGTKKLSKCINMALRVKKKRLFKVQN